MRLLLDTHFLVWLIDQPARLTTAENDLLRAPTSELAVSAVSIWEIRLKWAALHQSGDRKGVVAPEAAVRFVARMDIRTLPMTERHASATLREPIAHKDPFDELLLVQAQLEDMRLLTRDSLLVGHPLAFTA